MATFTTTMLRLAPANPILLRVVTGAGRRWRDALLRVGYLGLLVLVVGGGQLFSINQTDMTELARQGSQLFRAASFVQLTMICLLAPIFTAGAITQERDARTYNILLSTPLSNSQIVIGTLFSRLYFVGTLLLSGVPVFALLLFYGGVTGWAIFMSFAIALGSALFTGALALSLAVFRLGTGKMVFWFFLANVVYLLGLWFIEAASTTGTTSYLTGIHPFLALSSVLTPTSYPVPDPATLTHLPGLVQWYMLNPALAFVLLAVGLSLVMTIPAAILLRYLAQIGETGPWDLLMQKILPKFLRSQHKARSVWHNPIAWREAMTRGGMTGRGLTRWFTLGLGLIGGLWLAYAHIVGDMTVEQVRQWSVGLILTEFAAAVLVAANAAATAVTKERESQTLDILLITPITSKYYLWGKLRGLIGFLTPFVMIMTLTVVILNVADAFTPGDDLIHIETIVLMPVYTVMMLALACILGLHLSLQISRTLLAIMACVGILVAVAGLAGMCGFALASHASWFGLLTAGFSPVTALSIMLNPNDFAVDAFGSGKIYELGTSTAWMGRILFAVSCLLSAGLCVLVVWFAYRSMVYNFDMIIRRQHR